MIRHIVGTTIRIGYIRTDHQTDILVDYLFTVLCRNCSVIIEQGQRNNGTDATVAQPTAAPPPVPTTNPNGTPAAAPVAPAPVAPAPVAPAPVAPAPGDGAAGR